MQSFDFRNNFDRLSFLFCGDLLPSVPPSVISRIERRSSSGCMRPSDAPSNYSGDGTPRTIGDWVKMRSTSDQHEQWRRDRLNLLLHTRRTMGFRVPAAELPSFTSDTGIEPIVVREGRRSDLTMLFRIGFGDGDEAPEVPALRPQIIVPTKRTADVIEFLGEGRTVLIHGTAANGSPVQLPNIKRFSSVPSVSIAKLEGFWQQLGRRYRPPASGQHPPAPLMDPRQQLGRFCYPALVGRLPRNEADFLRWLVDNGHAVGFDGALAVLVRCPWHRQIHARASNQPARFDLQTGELRCTHLGCADRTNLDFEMRTGFRVL
jgi:hypothetical protein